MMGLKFVSTVTGLLLGHAFAAESNMATFECALNTTFHSSNHVANQTNCCRARHVPVAGDKVYCEDFICDNAAGLYVKKGDPAADRLEGSDATTCCRAETCDDDSDNTKKFCADAKMAFNDEDDKKDLPKTTANCCKAFVKMCMYNTKYVPGHPYDLFPCESGTTFNVSAAESLSPTQAVCCEPRKETCSMVSGSVLEPTPFKCPAGFTTGDEDTVKNLDASQANCCIAWTATCVDINDDGLPDDIFQCPDGKIFSGRHENNKTATEANCCTAPTCEEHKMLTCSELPAERKCSEKDNKILDDAKANFHYLEPDWCCKRIPVEAGGGGGGGGASTDFSSAGRTGTASALSFLLLAPVVLL